MSRNDKIRKMAGKLPPFPKLKNNKVIQRDVAGNIIYCNHFRELKHIQDKHMDLGKPSNHPDILKEWAMYSKMVMAYDKAKGKKNYDVIAFLIVLIAIAVIIYTIKSLLRNTI
jgi:hypothetical protein